MTALIATPAAELALLGDFLPEAIHWLERLFELRQDGKGYAGWSAWRPLGEFKVDEDPVMGWVPDAGFLTGSAGIGLALLGVLTPVEPEWDHVLLSSVRPRSGGAPAGG